VYGFDIISIIVFVYGLFIGHTIIFLLSVF